MVLDSLKQFGPLPAELLPFQAAAHRRSQQIGQQIQSSLKTESPVPLNWSPVDTSAPFGGYKPPAPPPPSAAEVAALFPSAATGPVRR